MLAVKKHQAGPVFARIDGLLSAVHFDGFARSMIVVHAHHGVLRIGQIEQGADIVKPEEITIAKQGPPLKPSQVGGQKAGVGEFGRSQGVDRAVRRPRAASCLGSVV